MRRLLALLVLLVLAGAAVYYWKYRPAGATPQQETFSSLLARARAGDAEAIAELYRNHARRVMAVVRRRLRPVLRAEGDTPQEHLPGAALGAQP